MLPAHRKKSLDAIRRLEGLTKTLRVMIEKNDYCPKILEIALALQGHVKHVQGQILESHLHTCAPKKLGSKKEKDTFIRELIRVIGLSKR